MLSSQILKAMLFRPERPTLGRLGPLERCPQTLVLLRDEAYATLDAPRIP